MRSEFEIRAEIERLNAMSAEQQSENNAWARTRELEWVLARMSDAPALSAAEHGGRRQGKIEGMIVSSPCRIYHIREGGHVHCHVFFGPEGAAGKCGDLTFRVDEFPKFQGLCKGVLFIDEDAIIAARNEATP